MTEAGTGAVPAAPPAGGDPWAAERWPTDAWSALAPPPPAEPWLAEQPPTAAPPPPWPSAPPPSALPSAAPPPAGPPPAGPTAADLPSWAARPAALREPAEAPPPWLPPPRDATDPPTDVVTGPGGPGPAPERPTHRPPARRRGTAVLVAAVLLVAAIAITTILVVNRRGHPAPVAVGPTSVPPATGTATPPATATPTTGAPTSSPPAGGAGSPAPTAPGVPAGFRRVTGVRGVTTAVPADWTVKPGLVPEDREADDPNDANRFVRFGGYAAVTRTELDRVLAIEQTVTRSAGVRDYRRLRMQEVRYGAAAAVDWEFTFTSAGAGGQRRHSFGRYWRFGKSDYVIYASAPDADWARLQPIIAVLLQTGAPH